MTAEQKQVRNAVVLVSLIGVLLTTLVAGIIVYARATLEMSQGQKEAVTLAKKEAGLQTVDHFYWFSREATYFSVAGKDRQGREVFVIISKDGDPTIVLNQKDGLSEQAVQQLVERSDPQAHISKINLGLYKGEPVWEVVTKSETGEYTYHLIAFNNGTEISVIGAI